MTSAAAPPTTTLRPVLPSHGTAKVKNVLSGDTVVLLGKAPSPNAPPPQVVFTFERVTAPRMASKANDNRDDPGAFPAREWLRNLVVGKNVQFETRKQGATAGDRVYGLLFMTDPNTGEVLNLAVESVRNGHATPKVFGAAAATDATSPEESAPQESETDDNTNTTTNVDTYESRLQVAFAQAQAAGVGVHGSHPLVRTIQNAGVEFQTLALVQHVQSIKSNQNATVTCVMEYVFDGSRLRVQVTDPSVGEEWQYASFTLLLAGISCPRMGHAKLDPPTLNEPLAVEARQFVDLRLLHRQLPITLYGTDKAGICAVGTVHHPKGNIAVELLKHGLAKMSDWSVRLMDPPSVPALRIAENNAKRANLGIWHSYAPPQLSGASEIVGTVVEVLTGDTVSILPNGVAYDSESVLKKVSLASVRAPRVGNDKLGRPEEPCAAECKDRLRLLTVGKPVKVTIHYERDIPSLANTTTEKRQFGTLAVGKKEDVGQVLVTEGLATTQRHRDEDEKSPRYDLLVAAEATAKAAKKGVHNTSTTDSGRRAVNDLTDPKKAKAYSGSLMRAGNIKAIVEYVFNGSRFKLLVPSENCNIVFAASNLRCPQPSSPSFNNNSRSGANANRKPAEPFGDASKRHARLTVLQRTVEITCTGVSMGGVITGQIFVGQQPRRDYSLELVGAGLASLDARKVEYGEVPKLLVDAQTAAQNQKVGIWSLEQSTTTQEVKPSVTTKAKEQTITLRLSEIKSGNHFFFQKVGDDAAKVMDESMKLFTSTHGTNGAPCDVKVGKVVAALFNDGSGKSWYRAKIVERPAGGGGKARVLFVDHGNTELVPVASHLRPLDASLGTERVPPVAKEAQLALTVVRPLSDDEGMDAARMLQSLAWGKDLTARTYCEIDGKLAVALMDSSSSNSSINELLVAAGLARTVKPSEVDMLASKMLDGNSLASLSADLMVAQETARKSRSGMWRYGDVGDEDEEE